MKTRPILFNGPMVRALLDGSKTQTRRVVKLPHQNPLGSWESFDWGGPNGGRTAQGETVPFQQVIAHTRTGEIISCPHGQPGDRLWVRESFSKIIGQTAGWIETDYKATYKHGDRMGDLMGAKKKWTPSIHMPRDASRITLEIVSVRVERLQDISDPDALAEGVSVHQDHYGKPRTSIYSPVQAYHDIWEAINGPGSWDANPWVWVVEFKKITNGAPA